MKNKLKIVCISDTHRQHFKMEIPDGDILLFAGDAEIDSFDALQDFDDWLGTLNFKHVVVIGGNHDFFTQECNKKDLKYFFTNAIYLENESIQIEGIKIFGSPYSPKFNNWAWMLNAKQLEQIWELIPKDTDILLTHTPPFGILANTEFSKFTLGCPALLRKIEEIKAPYSVFGHIHGGSGVLVTKNTTFINASMLDDYYKYVNEPKVFYYKQ